jgi:hypothetical protein
MPCSSFIWKSRPKNLFRFLSKRVPGLLMLFREKDALKKMIISLFFFFEINLPVKYAYRSRVQEITFIWKSKTDSISNMFRVLTFWLFIFCRLKGGMVSLRCGSRKPVGRLKAIFLSQQFYSCLGGNVQKTLVT